MSVFERIWAEELKVVNTTLSDYLDFRIKEASKISDHNQEFYQNLKEYFMRGGKRLRPILVAIGYKAINDSVEVENLYRAALSVEILHNGSLVHDDLIDHDETRRGGPTFHARYRDNYLKKSSNKEKAFDWGMTNAILGGDCLINMGSQAIHDSNLEAEVASKCLWYYNDAFQSLVDGVHLEMNMIYMEDISPEIYLTMNKMKTAVLFYRSLEIGATIAKATESQLSALYEFGLKVGQAFQIQDDILGSFGDEAKTGKSADGDIKEGKKTMLLLQSYINANSEQKAILDALVGKDGISNEEVEKVRNTFKASGGFDATNKIMETLLAEGQSALEKAEPPLTPTYKEFLLALSVFLTKRDY
ncbi:MAG: polyprenyl synthetase family protein [Candidatus Thorarchaeota archaeon]|jgi:geranylgeranyl diphosphate synthase type I